MKVDVICRNAHQYSVSAMRAVRQFSICTCSNTKLNNKENNHNIITDHITKTFKDNGNFYGQNKKRVT